MSCVPDRRALAGPTGEKVVRGRANNRLWEKHKTHIPNCRRFVGFHYDSSFGIRVKSKSSRSGEKRVVGGVVFVVFVVAMGCGEVRSARYGGLLVNSVVA